MKDLSFFSKIYLATVPVDFRKQAHGLAVVVEHSLKLSPVTDKFVFVFTNKRRNAVKILYWDSTGFALWWKSLEAEKFAWPKSSEETLLIQNKELKWLLEGIDYSKIKKHKKVILD